MFISYSCFILSPFSPQFLLQVIECCENYNADGLTMAIREYNNITPLDNWKTTMLLRVKNSIAGEGHNEDMT